MALAVEAINDLLMTTLNNFKPVKWENMATTRQRYVALRHIMKEKKQQVESGPQIEWRLMYKLPNSAANKGAYATDTYNQEDLMTKATIPWRRTWGQHCYDHVEIDLNGPPARIIELVKPRRAGAYGAIAELVETNFWGADPASTDSVTPYSINSYVVYNATAGFTGANPTNHAHAMPFMNRPSFPVRRQSARRAAGRHAQRPVRRRRRRTLGDRRGHARNELSRRQCRSESRLSLRIARTPGRRRVRGRDPHSIQDASLPECPRAELGHSRTPPRATLGRTGFVGARAPREREFSEPGRHA